MSARIYPKNGKLRYNIAGREPWAPPETPVELPAPPELPNPPSSLSLLTMILPPVLMLIGGVVMFILGGGTNPASLILSAMMAVGYPSANLINQRVQKKKYAKSLVTRKENYQKTLTAYRVKIEQLIQRQREVMHAEFPPIQDTMAIGCSRGKNKRLWWRRPNDYDFLNLRLGNGGDEPSFQILPPRMINQKDPLSELPFELMENFEQVSNLPFLVDLKRLGSLVIYGKSFRCVIRVVRRLLVDVIVHHSPEDLNLVVLANRRNAIEEWEWLKWVPHTHLLDSGQERQTLLFTTDKINSFLDDLKALFFERMEAQKSIHDNEIRINGQSYLVILDDEGVRQHEDIRRIAAEGWLVGIYLVFVTDFNVPATYRARVEVDTSGRLDYLETFNSQGAGNRRMGMGELVSKSQAEPLARSLAGMEVAGGKSSAVLPSTVRVVDMIDGDPYSVPEIIELWRNPPEDSRQVLLPVGQFVDRDGLATYEIDFRPESSGGKGAYHAMMIGTTGSGKSIFMQSLVLAAARKYSPREINFMFMDFKAGAAELKKVSELPHSVGMVTDLSPALADRALQALENELSRRKLVFDNAGKITDIWDYNRRFPEHAMPQLVVMIDEFAEGIKILPNLVERLKELGRQGRAFGMYFFLANQEVNSAVDALKANVSWYVLLKVNRQEEMNLIARRLPVPPGRGRGYVKVKNDITSIQSAYAGLPANVGDQEDSEVTEFVIATFGPDGRRNEVFRYDPRKRALESDGVQTELELLMSVITEASKALNIPPANPIYTEPLPVVIPLRSILLKQEIHRLFNGQDWVHKMGEKNIVPLGYLDIPNRCAQPPFSLNFNERGGHLWIVGMPGSGKNAVLMSLASALCLTHNPSELNLYVLDFGNGQISVLKEFPHTGAVIRGHEKERVDRLIRFLQEEMRIRTEFDWRGAGKPEIYLVINNVADLRSQYQEMIDDLGRLIRTGGSVGIHLIITSNRGQELQRSLSGSMNSRIVLQLSEAQEYLDLLGGRFPPLTMRTEGRGYLCMDDDISECQVGMVTHDLVDQLIHEDDDTHHPMSNNERNTEQIIKQIFQVVAELGKAMAKSWLGERPLAIRAMLDNLPLDAFELMLTEESAFQQGSGLPIGLRYENLLPFVADIRKEGPFWTILGGRQSGKSTSLVALTYFLKKYYGDQVHVSLIPFRRGPLSQIQAEDGFLKVLLKADEIVEEINQFAEKIQSEQEILHVLIMDDAGLAFAGSNSALTQALNQLGDRLNMIAHDNFLIVIADLYSNLKTPQTYSSSFLKLFQQSQTGIFFSLDETDMQWFNARVSLFYKKTLKWMPGRGFFVRKGETDYIQSPWIEAEQLDVEEIREVG